MGIKKLELNSKEREFIFELFRRLTGHKFDDGMELEVLISNVKRRISACQCETLEQYLYVAVADSSEFDRLVSGLAIHTTSWFREFPHFEKLKLDIDDFVLGPKSEKSTIKVLSAACSTGEEVYSFALALEAIRLKKPKFDYQVDGVDIDPVSVATGKNGVYNMRYYSEVKPQYRKLLLRGSGDITNSFTVNRDIRERVNFSVLNLFKAEVTAPASYDYIVCRNVLIYFSHDEVKKIVDKLLKMLLPDGMLILGHSDLNIASDFDLSALGNSTYRRNKSIQARLPKVDTSKKSILIVDDSQTVRKVFEKKFHEFGFHVESVDSAEAATEFLRTNQPDLITLDLNMPGTDGKTWLKRQRLSKMQIPVVVITESDPSGAGEVLGALEIGAQDFVEKSMFRVNPTGVLDRVNAIIGRYQDKSDGKVSSIIPQSDTDFRSLERPDVILIGASTGGPGALVELLRRMPQNCPPVLLVQHIQEKFAPAFAERMADISGLKLGEMKTGETIKDGHIYIPTGNYHLVMSRMGNVAKIKIGRSQPIFGHRPSVDSLFKSARGFDGNIVAVLLTGMGKDGAAGLLDLKKSGATTMTQSEESCVVYGMPKAANDLKASMFCGDLKEIRKKMDYLIKKRLQGAA